jgi:hypothetical protein
MNRTILNADGSIAESAGTPIPRVVAALGILAVTGAMLPELTRRDTPAHLVPRRGSRRVRSARELHEAADLAERGEAVLGTSAAAQLKEAERTGQFARAMQLREAIKGYAPTIRAAAIAQEAEDARAGVATVRAAVVSLRALERAKAKRARKASRRLAQMDS